nr:hypothetical protein [Acetivibrio clariflavus]
MRRRRTNCLSKLANFHMKLPGLKKNLADSKSREDRMKMIEREEKKLSIKRQAELLGINRTSLYYKPVPVTDEEYLIKNVLLMRVTRFIRNMAIAG